MLAFAPLRTKSNRTNDVGSAVMVKTNPGDHASLVTVGKGVTPPM